MLYKVKAFSKRREIGFVEDSEIVELFLNRDQNAILQMSKKYGRKIRCMANNILHDCQTARCGRRKMRIVFGDFAAELRNDFGGRRMLAA